MCNVPNNHKQASAPLWLCKKLEWSYHEGSTNSSGAMHIYNCYICSYVMDLTDISPLILGMQDGCVSTDTYTSRGYCRGYIGIDKNNITAINNVYC